MAKKKPDETPILESVKVEKKYVDLARENKKKTYKPIGVYLAEAIAEKHERENKSPNNQK